jgi:hypothetical protein
MPALRHEHIPTVRISGGGQLNSTSHRATSLQSIIPFPAHQYSRRRYPCKEYFRPGAVWGGAPRPPLSCAKPRVAHEARKAFRGNAAIGEFRGQKRAYGQSRKARQELVPPKPAELHRTTRGGLSSRSVRIRSFSLYWSGRSKLTLAALNPFFAIKMQYTT